MAKSTSHKKRSTAKPKSVKGKGSSQKGGQGKDTGVATRAAIKAKVKGGCSMADIGKAVNRDDSTISAIANGKVKNPPNGLAGKIRKVKCKKK